jgi:hypothetical protein
MPSISYTDQFSISSDSFKKLTAKGDKVHFRLLNDPVYEGKHFIKQGDEWLVEPCPRINAKQECFYCEQFFGLMKEAKAETDKDKIEEIKKEANKSKATIIFYFPILNRDEEIFQILQGPKLFFDKLGDEAKAGINILEKDYIMTRTEKPGSDYYVLTRMDSADTKPLTEKEIAESAKKNIAIEDFVGIKKEKPVSDRKSPRRTPKDPIMEVTAPQGNPEPIPWEQDEPAE